MANIHRIHFADVNQLDIISVNWTPSLKLTITRSTSKYWDLRTFLLFSIRSSISIILTFSINKREFRKLIWVFNEKPSGNFNYNEDLINRPISIELSTYVFDHSSSNIPRPKGRTFSHLPRPIVPIQYIYWDGAIMCQHYTFYRISVMA